MHEGIGFTTIHSDEQPRRKIVASKRIILFIFASELLYKFYVRLSSISGIRM
jgi:hypothetical protein